MIPKPNLRPSAVPIVTKPAPMPARIAGGPLTDAIRDGRVKSRIAFPARSAPSDSVPSASSVVKDRNSAR